MANPHYKAGARFEYEMMTLLKKHLHPDKYTIIRTAGSHSPVDVVIIRHISNTGPKRKFTKTSKTEEELIKDMNDEVDDYVDKKVFGIQCKTKKNG